MSEGLFSPARLPVPGVPADRLSAALVRVLPTTRLRLTLADSREAAFAAARNETLADGTELWHRAFTHEDLARANDPVFAMAMVQHEFAQAVRAGARFPVEVPLIGGGGGSCLDAAGHVLTNYHLVTGEIERLGRQGGVLGVEQPCLGVRAEVASRGADGRWALMPAERVWLVSNPPASRAIHDLGNGRGELREDWALLRVEPPPLAALTLAPRPAVVGETVWMAGFPLRSARPAATRAALGYDDADGSLRVSHGQVTALGEHDSFVSDLDGSMGSSGSPVFDADGGVIGVFSRVAGNGPRNAFEYGGTPRVHVGMRGVVAGMGWAAAGAER